MQQLLATRPNQAAVLLLLVTVIWALSLGCLNIKYALFILPTTIQSLTVVVLVGTATLSVLLQIVLNKPYPQVYKAYRGLSIAWYLVMVILAITVL